MQLYAKEYGDISKYYHGTYVKLPQFGDKIFYVAEVTRERVELHDEAGDLFHIELAQEDEPAYSLEYVLPHRAVFSYKGSVVLLTRVPARQYSRGCCSANTKMLDVFSGKGLDISFRTLQAFVNKPTYYTLDEALYGEFPKTCVGVALNERFSFHRNQQQLYVDHITIATFIRDSMTWVVNRPIFLPEIKALCSSVKKEMRFLDASGKAL